MGLLQKHLFSFSHAHVVHHIYIYIHTLTSHIYTHLRLHNTHIHKPRKTVFFRVWEGPCARDVLRIVLISTLIVLSTNIEKKIASLIVQYLHKEEMELKTKTGESHGEDRQETPKALTPQLSLTLVAYLFHSVFHGPFLYFSL